MGITRAKKQLYMTYALSRRLYNNTEYTIPSRFLEEISPEYKEDIFWRGYDRMDEWSMGRGTAKKANTLDDSLEPGDMVNHRSFGFGVVLAVEGSGDKAKITVDFQEIGKKTLVQQYARLEKV